MEVGTARKEIGARQAAEGELSPVGTAADGSDFRRNADGFHGRLSQGDDVHMTVFDFFQHVIVDVPFVEVHRPLAVFIGKESSHLPQEGLSLFKKFPVVVADEDVHRARFDVAVQFIDVEEAFMAFGVFRFFPGRQELLPFSGHGQGVFHLALGIAGMDAAAVEGNGPISSVEVFIFKTRCSC